MDTEKKLQCEGPSLHKIEYVYIVEDNFMKSGTFCITLKYYINCIYRHRVMLFKYNSWSCWWAMDMVFNITFNNISVISWRSVLLLKETGENLRSVTSHWQTLLHNVVSSIPRHDRDSNSLHCMHQVPEKPISW